MYIIAGLGNPTKKYEKTRHNVGFDTIDLLAERLGIKMGRSVFKAKTGKGMIGSEKVILVQPLTFMNLSGNAIQPILKFYKEDPKTHLIVIYDDADLDLGKIRVRAKGSPGSHNGMKHITQVIGNGDFARVRVGIGHRPEKIDMVDFVLGHLNKEERKVLEDGMSRAADAVKDIVEQGVDFAMNRYNGQ